MSFKDYIRSETACEFQRLYRRSEEAACEFQRLYRSSEEASCEFQRLYKRSKAACSFRSCIKG